MANRILLQTLLRFSDQIKSGAAKVQDVVTDYFNQTGKSVTDEERGIILKEFQDNAPSNVTTLEGVDPVETIMPMGGETTGRINYPLMEKQLGVKLRGDETFDELLEIEKNTKETNQGLGSLFPKGEPGSIFDQKNSNRMEVAAFMRAMREAGIRNKDVMEVIRDKTRVETQPAQIRNRDAPKEVVNIKEGKRDTTTIGRDAKRETSTKRKEEQ